MKTARLIFLLFACGALICGADYRDRTASDDQREQRGSHTSQKPHRPNAKAPVESKSGKQLPKRQAHLARARAMNPRGGSDRSSLTAKGSLTQNPTDGKYRLVHSRSSVRAAAPLRSNVRHRSPNPAVIAGSASLGNRNSGAIDGRQVPRRP